jgi:hypothetical protein
LPQKVRELAKTPFGVLGPKDHVVKTDFATKVRELAKTPFGVLGPKDHVVKTDFAHKCARIREPLESSGLNTTRRILPQKCLNS